MDPHLGMIALQSLVSLAGISVALFWLYGDYRVDLFRQQMFSLRDEMFDEALSGQVTFDHAAYGILRSTMNGYIRFGHRISLTQLLILAFTLRKSDFNSIQGFDEKLDNALCAADETTKKIYLGYKRKMELLVAEQLILSSPILLLTVILPIVAIVVMNVFVSGFFRAFRHPLNRLDSAAMAFGR